MSEPKKDDEDFSSFVSTALRRPKKSVRESAICQYLVLSISATPLKALHYLTQAAFLLTPEQAETVEISHDELDVIHTVTLAFENALRQTYSYSVPISRWYSEQVQKNYYTLVWGFRETYENYQKYIAPWQRDQHLLFQHVAMSLEQQSNMKTIEASLKTLRSQAQSLVEQIGELEGNTSDPNMRVKKNLRKLRSELKDSEAEFEEVSTHGFYVCCKYLMPQSFFNLQNQFLNWALPRAQTVFSKLAQHVNPDTYNKVLKMQMEKEERSDESSMDQRIRTSEV